MKEVIPMGNKKKKHRKPQPAELFFEVLQKVLVAVVSKVLTDLLTELLFKSK
jgi:hypothetical protein